MSYDTATMRIALGNALYPAMNYSRNSPLSLYNLALGGSVVGRSKSLISPAASLSQKLILSLPKPLLTTLNWMLSIVSCF